MKLETVCDLAIWLVINLMFSEKETQYSDFQADLPSV